MPANYTAVSLAVGMRFLLDGDGQRDAHPYLGQLLDRGVRALVLAGAYDLGCNWVGNERMSRALDWYGKEAFNGEALGEWEVEGKKAGKMRTWGPLAFASVYGAGHMVSVGTCS